ncbi:MAG: DUF2891 family protein [Gammaproteobacteria bacterium]|nr:DUF2891 family protein [Gammaproteobacteria bacterium]
MMAPAPRHIRLSALAPLAVVLAASCATDAADQPAEDPDAVAAASSPAPTDPGSGPVLDLETALSLAAMPLSCVDRPHALRPDRAGYLDDISYTRRRDFDRNRAFYGCWDWHSAVNSTWAMLRLVKEVPDLPVALLIREKLRDHLSEEALAGELEYLSDNPSFERPYGWVWLLLLHGELASWDDPFAAVWAERLEPVVSHLSDRLIDYLEDLERPVRTGVHPNTAFAIATGLQAEQMAARPELAEALRTSAERFFGEDRNCPVAYEPGRSDFLSPCLEEAALMGMVLDPDAYAAWLDGFLPAPDSDEFEPLLETNPAGAGDEEPPEGDVVTNDSLRSAYGTYSHLIGLAFTRADAMLRIAAALPGDDPRVPELRALATRHARTGYDTMFDADYAGSHWIGSFALKYLVLTTGGPSP